LGGDVVAGTDDPFVEPDADAVALEAFRQIAHDRFVL